MTWLLVALGGAIGTSMRFGLALLGRRVAGESWFPVGTFAANVLGSLLLGVVFVLLEDKTIAGVDARLVVGTGVMGGFTTYSTFNLELLELLSEEPVRGGLYLVATLATCLGAAALGLALGRAVV
ncbi:MAG: CrcB family protein [Myxococcota bacterium]